MEADRQLTDAFFEHHPTEAARALEAAPPAEIGALLSEMESPRVAPVVAAMEQAFAAAVIRVIESRVAARMVGALPPRTASALLRRIDPPARSAILDRLSSRTASRLGGLLQYPEGSAGALLDPSAQTAPPDVTAGEMLERLHTASGTVHAYLYVVDRRGILIGVMTLQELIAASREAMLDAIAKRRIATLPATAGRAAIVTHPAWRDLRALPVVDREGRFLGIVRHETVRELESGASARALEPAAAGLALDIGELAWMEGAALVEDLIGAIDDAPGAARAVSTVAG